MMLNLNKLPATDNDKDFYRAFFVIVACVNVVFHFLYLDYAPESFDPLPIRFFVSVCCLFPVMVSFFDQKYIYKTFAYLALLLFLGINNFYFLGSNNFIGEYFVGSLLCFLLASIYCRHYYEMLLVGLINLAGFIGGFFLTTVYVEVRILVVSEVLFTAMGCFVFLLHKSYLLKVAKAHNDIESGRALVKQTSDWLQRNVDLVQSLTTANQNIVFECDEYKKITAKWYPHNDLLKRKTDQLINAHVSELEIGSLSYYVDTVLQTQLPTSFEAQSFLGNDLWYNIIITPVFNSNNEFAGRIIISLTDITDLKLTAASLKENELILYNEQVVAKIGSWWTDVSGKDIYWSNNLFSIMEVGQIPPERTKFNYYISLIHPEDRDAAQHFFAKLAGNPLAEFEHRMITPRGNLKYFKVVSGFPVKDDNGKVLKVAGIVQDITDIKIADKIIRQSQTDLMEVQSIAKIGGWNWDITLNDLAWTDEIYNIYELDKEEVKDADHFKLLLAFVHPDDKELVATAFRDHLKVDRSFIEYRIITNTGKLKYVCIIIGKTIKKDGAIKRIVGSLQDLTERKKIEFDFERSENKYKNVLATINLAAVTLDKNGLIVFCNKHLADILGYDRIELLGMNWVTHFVPQYLQEQFASWLQSNSFYAQHTSPVICRNGKQRIINWKNTVTHDEFGAISETTSIGEDITDIKKAREALIMAKENAEKSSRFKSEFLSIMSHEIRTPMNAVIGTTNLLLQDNPAPRQLEYLNTLQFSSNNLLELINDILDYNKIEAGKLELYKLPFNLQKLIQNILLSFNTKAEENGTRIELKLDRNIPTNLIGDQLRLGQILNNLLSNAVKFTRNGKIYLTLDAEDLRRESLSIKFSVRDTGIGIAKENIDKIFDPFTQEYQSTHSDYGGTGLGLAITKRLVELHHANITLASKPGEGTEFSFTILFDKAEVDEPAEAEIIPVNSESNVRGMSILLVDDNKMNLLIASKFLKNWQATVEQAMNGKIAVDMALSKTYDLVIMDLQMPVMDGFEASKIIKKSKPHLPIIALSADAMPETSVKALQSGMNDYMTKPFVPEILFSKISKYYKGYVVNGE